MTISIVVADERRLISETIAETLKMVRDFEVVEVINDSQEIIPAVMRMLPSVVVLGAARTGRDELHMADQLCSVAPDCGVAVIAAEPSRAVTGRALATGVFSVVPSNARLAHLIHAIRGLVAGAPARDSAVVRTPVRNGRHLNDREREVLRLTVSGAPVKEIAAELHLSPGTVRNLTSSAIKKLDGRNRFDAARIASNRGWL